MRTKIGIVGSRAYTNKKNVKDLIFKIKEKYGDDVEIVSGGQKDGADGYAKKVSLDFDIKYSEFPPQHYPHNIHCVNESYNYGKPYRVWNYHKRNREIVEYCDNIVAFCTDGKITNGTKSALKYCEKAGKKHIIID